MALRIIFRDRFDVNHPAAYGEIARIEIDRVNKKATIVVNLFNNLGAFVKGAVPFDKTEFSAENSLEDFQFDDFFDDTILETAGVSPLTQAESYLIAKVARFAGAIRI